MGITKEAHAAQRRPGGKRSDVTIFMNCVCSLLPSVGINWSKLTYFCLYYAFMFYTKLKFSVHFSQGERVA